MSRVLAALLVVIAAVIFVIVQFLRPVPAVAAQSASTGHAIPGTPPTLAWPAQGEAAFGVVGAGVVSTHGAQTETPLASVTKIMTAYVILHDHPLATGQPGPSITITPADVALYQKDKTMGYSVVAVQAGEQLTEQQALEAMLLPSGDNIAVLLADWDAGSEPAFIAKMNATASTLKLAHTHYVDVSGVQPGTVSTASDQVRLAMAAMANPVFRHIVSLPQATIPVAGLQYNVDALLGHSGIIGIKTGWTTPAGGCFVFAANDTIDGKSTTLVGAVLHQLATTAQPSALQAAFDASTALLASMQHAVVRIDTMHAGTSLGQLTAPWSTPVALHAARSVTMYALPGEQVHTKVELPSRLNAPIQAGQHIGTAVVTLGAQSVQVPLVAARALPAVSLTWRLTNL